MEMEKEKKGDDWLEPKDVAKEIGVSERHVYTMLRQVPPPWPFYRTTKTKRLTRRADLDAWLEKVKVLAITPEQTFGA